MKQSNFYRQINLLIAVICAAYLLAPFSAKSLLASVPQNGLKTQKSEPAFIIVVNPNGQTQPTKPAAPLQSLNSLNIYIFLPIVAAPPIQTRAERSPMSSASGGRVYATQVAPAGKNLPMSLNIYIFLPTANK